MDGTLTSRLAVGVACLAQSRRLNATRTRAHTPDGLPSPSVERHSARVGNLPALRAAITQSVWAWRRPAGRPSGSIEQMLGQRGQTASGTAGSGS